MPFAYDTKTQKLTRTMCVLAGTHIRYGSFDYMRRLFLFEFKGELTKKRRLKLLRKLEEFRMVDEARGVPHG